MMYNNFSVCFRKEADRYIKARSHPERKDYEKNKDHLHTWTRH